MFNRAFNNRLVQVASLRVATCSHYVSRNITELEPVWPEDLSCFHVTAYISSELKTFLSF